MPERQKTKLTLPSETGAVFSAFTDTTKRDTFIRALRAAGWTLQSIAESSGLTRERVRQIAAEKPSEDEPTLDIEVPLPPFKAAKPTPVYVEPDPEKLARLLELKPKAERVRSGSKYRKEGEEYTKLVWDVHKNDGVTLYRLALRLGVSHGALRFRLARYGYKLPKTGKSRVYKPIIPSNRFDETVDSEQSVG